MYCFVFRRVFAFKVGCYSAEVVFAGVAGEGSEDAGGMFKKDRFAFECAFPAQAFGGCVCACP